MNNHCLEILEFFRFLELVQSYAKTAAGKHYLSRLRPQHKQERAFKNRGLYKSLIELKALLPDYPVPDFEDPTELLKELAPIGSTLEMGDFLLLRQLLLSSAEIKAFLNREHCKKHDSLNDMRDGIHSFRLLRDELDAVFDESHKIKDNASPELKAIRPSIKKLEKSLTNRLQTILRHGSDDVFQEKIITTRNNRYVIPVRRSEKSQVRGIIHDESSTGQTLFIEPQSTIPLGNELVEMKLAEEKEIRRLLALLSEKAREHIPEIKQSFHFLKVFDMSSAVAAWAIDYKCHFPEVSKDYDVRQGRHPLLEEQLRKNDEVENLVPLDLALTKTPVLAITGSNTGGKTISLKTIGLLSLIFQTGLPLPSNEGSTLPFYSNILADIGDEQSIEQSLSTFSGHLKNIAEILNLAEKGRTLILLDELGSGTDPVEGGALGCGIIEHLAELNSQTFITTHLGMIKVYVQNHPKMKNASVRFNRETLEPEYVLQVGIPGASHALAIAERFAIPEAVLEKARANMSDDQLNLETVLDKLDAERKSLEDDVREAREAREKAVSEREAIKKELNEIRTKRKVSLHKAQREAESIVENTRKEMSKILTNAGKATKEDKNELKKAHETVLNKRNSLRKGIEQTVERTAKPLKKEDVKVGLTVWIEKLQNHAIVQSISSNKKKVTIDDQGLIIELKITELAEAKNKDIFKQAQKEAQEPAKVSHNYRKGNVPLELKLIGERIEPALMRLEAYVSDALAAEKAEVKIVHGRGTGQLRTAIHKWLSNCSYVSKYYMPKISEDSSGDAVTYVRLQ